MAAAAVDRWGGLHVLFSNAGTSRPGTAVELEPRDRDLVMNVNVRRLNRGAKYAVPAMEAGGGLRAQSPLDRLADPHPAHLR